MEKNEDIFLGFSKFLILFNFEKKKAINIPNFVCTIEYVHVLGVKMFQ